MIRNSLAFKAPDRTCQSYCKLSFFMSKSLQLRSGSTNWARSMEQFLKSQLGNLHNKVLPHIVSWQPL